MLLWQRKNFLSNATGPITIPSLRFLEICDFPTVVEKFDLLTPVYPSQLRSAILSQIIWTAQSIILLFMAIQLYRACMRSGGTTQGIFRTRIVASLQLSIVRMLERTFSKNDHYLPFSSIKRATGDVVAKFFIASSNSLLQILLESIITTLASSLNTGGDPHIYAVQGIAAISYS